MFNTDDIVSATGGKVLSRVAEDFSGVGTDTRVDLSGQIFIALAGDNYDAHNFLDKAIQAGAAALVVHSEDQITEEIKNKVTVVLVEDTLKALQDLARFWKDKLEIPAIAITGSNGKTTTKEFLAQILSSKYSVAYNKGSFNNHWGVPLNLLTAKEADEVLIVEMGMNHKGEIESLCAIAHPDITVVNNVGMAHMGEFGSLEAVAAAKEEIYLSSPKSIGVFNLDNEQTFKMYQKHKEILPKAITFSKDPAKNTDVSLQVKDSTFESMNVTGSIGGVPGGAQVEVFGLHNIYNLMSAASLALAFGMSPADIWAALSRCKTTWGRNQVIKTSGKPNIVFDGYNANPDSMNELINNLNQIEQSGAKLLILGEMLELGDQTAEFHFNLGQKVAQSKATDVWFIGPSNKQFKDGFDSSENNKNLVISGTYNEKLAIDFDSMLKPEDIVFIKGSRGSKLEKVLEAWNIRN
ncbi:UDP-N-acetylmuramoyl-tripeptide--D-alanyl-D-alanine ligase [bacterium]|nr:UDP-N-acetylmuramoyl-tripeptide--D-alanyl-D-alanine ligase [bacterium]